MSSVQSQPRGKPNPPSATRIFMLAGVAWQVCVQAYWLLFFVRVVVDLGFQPLQLVLLGTAKEVAVLLLEIPTGVVADIYSRKRSVVLAFAVSGSAIALAGLVDSFPLLLCAAALWGLGLTFRSGAETAWLTGELGSPAAAETVLLRRARIEMLAVVAGVVLAAVLATVFSLGVALIMFGAILVFTAGLLAVVMPETGFTPVEGNRRDEFQTLLRDGFASTRQVRPLRILVTATVIAGFGSEAIDRLYVRRLDDLSLDAGQASGIAIVAGIVITQALVGATLLWLARHRLHGPALAPALALLLTGTAIGAGLLAQVNILAIACAGLVIQGATRAAIEPVKAAWTNAYAPANARATVHSFIGQAHSLGEVAGGITLGLVASVNGIATALTCSVVLYALAAVVIGKSSRSEFATTAETPA